MKELTKHSIWHCYCILGKVEDLLQGLEYPDNWMKCYEVIDKFIKGLPRKSIHSEQMKNRILKIEKNGVPRITGKNAPLGGVLTWNRKNNEKICTLYLNEQINDINQAKACGLSYGDWQIKQFPQRDSYIYFHRNTVNGSLSKDVNIRNPLVGYYPDFIFDMPGCGDPSNDHISNFKAHIEVYIYISERYADIKGEQEIEEFVMEMAKLANAIKVGKVKSVWCREWIDEFGDNHLENLIWAPEPTDVHLNIQLTEKLQAGKPSSKDSCNVSQNTLKKYFLSGRMIFPPKEYADGFNYLETCLLLLYKFPLL